MDTAPHRLLVCPSCRHHFAYRNFLRSRACPSCQVSLGFSALYRVALALFAIAVFLYCILAAPLALIARLLFLSRMSPLVFTPSALPDVQFVMGYLTERPFARVRLDYPHCLKQIRPIHRPIYRWARGGLCLALAIFAAKLKGFDWSFLIFVVSAYALPAFFFWDIFALDMFPPTRFEPTRSSVQILGIGKG